jgi:hypothetical protein
MSRENLDLVRRAYEELSKGGPEAVISALLGTEASVLADEVETRAVDEDQERAPPESRVSLSHHDFQSRTVRKARASAASRGQDCPANLGHRPRPVAVLTARLRGCVGDVLAAKAPASSAERLWKQL